MFYPSNYLRKHDLALCVEKKHISISVFLYHSFALNRRCYGVGYAYLINSNLWIKFLFLHHAIHWLISLCFVEWNVFNWHNFSIVYLPTAILHVFHHFFCHLPFIKLSFCFLVIFQSSRAFFVSLVRFPFFDMYRERLWKWKNRDFFHKIIVWCVCESK